MSPLLDLLIYLLGTWNFWQGTIFFSVFTCPMVREMKTIYTSWRIHFYQNQLCHCYGQQFQCHYLDQYWFIMNTLRPRRNGHHFWDDILKCIFFNENVWISITVSLRFVPNIPIDNKPALVQIMAWRRPGDKPLSEPMFPYFIDTYMRHSVSMS